MYEIKKNVPMPKTESRGRPAKYPFKNMEIGDSVFFEGISTSSCEYVAAQACGRKSGKKFTGRTSKDGLTIWRVA